MSSVRAMFAEERAERSLVQAIPGRVLYVDGKTVRRALGRTLLKSSDGGASWEYRASLPVSSWREWLIFCRLGRRLTRSGYHHLVLTGDDAGVVIAHRHVFQLLANNPKLLRRARLQGSRPPCISADDDRVYYGEYRSNPERSVVGVWASDDGSHWDLVWSFDNVRHIHGVFRDPYSPSISVTTGDEDHESIIWRTDDSFPTVEYVVGGKQIYRTVQLLFTPEYVYWGSDAPDEQNHIFRLKRALGRVETLASVNGPVFYGCTVGGWLFFSTVVEPSSVNRSRHAEVWAKPDGTTWKVIRRFRKDGRPMKYLQYGQVFFPAGPGDGEHLWCTPMATEYDQRTLRFSLSDLERTFQAR